VVASRLRVLGRAKRSTNSPPETANQTPLHDEDVDDEKTQENEKDLNGVKARARDEKSREGHRGTDRVAIHGTHLACVNLADRLEQEGLAHAGRPEPVEIRRVCLRYDPRLLK